MNEIEARAADIRRAYQRKWYKTHKEEVREYQRRYWERKARKEVEE